MNVDAFFTKGTTHAVCQDYARIGRQEGGPYAIIADGCSAAPDVDIGARLLTLAAESYVFRPISNQTFGHSVIARADTYAATMGLDPRALNSTLVILHVDTNKVAVIRMFGDGVVVHKQHAQLPVIHTVSFSNGAPYYLQYERDPRDKSQYLLEFGGQMHQTFWNASTKIAGQQIIEISLLQIPVSVWNFEWEKTEWVAIFSDGVEQFMRPEKSTTSKRTERVPLEEVVTEFTNFKPIDKPNFSNGFVQRRARRVFRDHPEWQNTDDFSMAVIAKGEQ